MWLLVCRKILANRWMMLCLLAGFIIVVAMVSSVPTYTDGILQYMLTQDMEDFQRDTNHYPGDYRLDLRLNYVSTDRLAFYDYYNQQIESEVLPGIETPDAASVKLLTAANLQATAVDEAKRTVNRFFVSAQTMSGLADHVTLVAGRMFEPGLDENNCFEVVVSENAYAKLELLMDTPYWVSKLTDDEPTYQFRVVGVIAQSSFTDPYWFERLSNYEAHILMDESVFSEVYLGDVSHNAITGATWFRAFDYHAITVHDLPGFLDTIDSHVEYVDKNTSVLDLEFRIHDTLKAYETRTVQLSRTLWIILVPLLAMLALYIFMVSSLIIRGDENEISQLRSRGASSFQIFLLYLYQGIILGGLALIIGPPVGFWLCRVVGAANGFLEFVNRSALPLTLRPSAYLYSAAAVVLFMLTMLIPAWQASRTGIVERKRKKSRFSDQPVWKKFFLDILTLAVAVYGYSQYDQFNTLLTQTGTDSTQISVDPLLFLISSLFILGCGLVFLRIYPFLIKLIFRAGQKWWPPSAYASLIHVGRSSGQEQFLMIFIILSIAVGIFNANSARTLNQNIEDRIYYEMGAEIVVDPIWESNADEVAERLEADSSASDVITYIEPDFTPYRNLDGVEYAAKVFSTTTGTVRPGYSNVDTVKKVRIMGVDTVDYGHVGWFRDDLLPYHWYNYLNLIADAPKGVLVSANLAEELGLEVGDAIFLSWNSQRATECTIYALIDSWPTYDPAVHAGMIVANLSFLQQTQAKEPYDIWLKKADGATDTQVNQALTDAGFELQDVSYANQELILMKNDPMLQGLNGMLTLSFIITMLITAIGFLIYWILSIRSRSLQFGIFRAMGMSLRSVLGILLWEQLMISVVSIVIAILLGGLTSDLFVPMLQMVFASNVQVPAFLVVATRADYLKIYAIIGCILAVGFGTLSRILAKMRIDQALKLGED